MKKLALMLSIIVATISAPVFAEGSAEAGQTKAAVCAACHGMDGNSLVAMFPKLAGQHAEYLNKQLHDFKASGMANSGKGRYDPTMAAFVLALTDQDIDDLSAYFASQKSSPIAVTDVPAAGMELYKAGDAGRGITACMACHGPTGDGMAAAGFPSLADQHPDYIKSQLTKFRGATRHNDLNGMMRDIAKKLTDADIDALAKYVSSLK
ncbi:MAG: cytochrome c4 [Shewanella sp.]|nr:cytochrome c4 [Shewanella sp.]